MTKKFKVPSTSTTRPETVALATQQKSPRSASYREERLRASHEKRLEKSGIRNVSILLDSIPPKSSKTAHSAPTNTLTNEHRVKISRKTGKLSDPDTLVIVYEPNAGVDAFVRQIANATQDQMIETERKGVRGQLVKDLAKRMKVPAVRMFSILGIPKATAEKKAADNKMFAGRGGEFMLSMVKLLGIAQALVANSTADAAQGFDYAKWLGEWIECPQPSLGGRKPADLLDAPTGFDVVARLLGSIESGAYQ